MPVRYIGRESAAHGKRLYDILLRLKNCGVGRMVIKNTYNKQFPEPSYFVITKAEPNMADPERAKGKVWASMVYRGKKPVENYCIPGAGTPDWRLVPKDEEHLYNDVKKLIPPEPIPFPDQVPYPPLLAKMFEKEIRKRGQEVKLPLMLDTELEEDVFSEIIQEKHLKKKKDGSPVSS